MGGLFIVISIPSTLHERKLWFEAKVASRLLGDSKNKCSDNLVRSASDGTINGKTSLDQGVVTTKITPSFTNAKQPHKLSMAEKLEQSLDELKILNAVWVLGKSGDYYQVSFCASDGEQCETIIEKLAERNIGTELNSTVSIIPCALNFVGKENDSSISTFTTQRPAQKSLQDAEESAWHLFVNSVRARMMVPQVADGVKTNATLTFDFLILLIIASITAALGLIENSIVILVASVLISPLMGPVMASTFGFAIRDWKLQKIGLLNEFLGLLLCVVIGFLFGLLVGYLRWQSPDYTWPTPEMLSSHGLRSLVVGMLTSLLSGAAVAIAVLGNYSSSLTGVAISASLMPPAVNAGLLWAVAVTFSKCGVGNAQPLAFSSNDPLNELILLGVYSITLTFINIICIFLMGIFVLKIKEINPRGSKDYYFRLLWKETFKIARDHKYNLHNQDKRMEEGTEVTHACNLFTQPAYKITNTWSAYGAMHHFNRPTVQELSRAWNLHPISSTSYKQPNMHADLQGSPILHPFKTRLWQSTTPSSDSSIDHFNTAFVITPQTPISNLTIPKKFVVTPAAVSSQYSTP